MCDHCGRPAVIYGSTWRGGVLARLVGRTERVNSCELRSHVQRTIADVQRMASR